MRAKRFHSAARKYPAGRERHEVLDEDGLRAELRSSMPSCFERGVLQADPSALHRIRR